MRTRPAVVFSALAACLSFALAASATPTLEAGWGHNLSVSASGQVWAWGENNTGKLGNGTTTNASVPVRSGALTGVVAVAAGASHSVALRSNGTVWTWGGGDALGLGPVNESRTPMPVPGITTAVAIAAGSDHVLVVLSNGTVRSWGANSAGQLGNGTSTTANSPVTVSGLTGVVRVTAGDDFSLALRSDGTVWAWGAGAHGELGVGSTAPTSCAGKDIYNSTSTSVPCARVPAQVFGVSSITAISARGRHSLALRSDGSVWAWGSGRYGQMGDNSGSNRLSPATVSGLTNITQVAAGFNHSLALRSDGSLWVWGLNNQGQLGVSSTSSCVNASGILGTPCVRAPVQAGSYAGAATIVAGGGHTLTVRPNGSVVAFGMNASGQLGFGLDPTVPTTLSAIDPHSPFFYGSFGASSSLGAGSTSGSINVGTIDDGLVFTSQALGSTSAAREVRFTNLAESAVVIRSITLSGDFSGTTSCASTVASQSHCSVFVNFTPASPGERLGVLTVTTSSTDAPTVSLPLSGTGTSATIPVNYSDIWWNPNESGWGLTLADHETAFFAVWYTYEASGRPTWFTITGGAFSSNRRYYTGDVYSTTGPCYSAPTFNPALVQVTRRGTVTLDFAPTDLPPGWARFTGSIGATSWSKAILRMGFGNASPTWGTDYTDIWWTGTEPGWGLTLAQHGGNIFGVLYTYDCDGTPLFVTLPGVAFTTNSSFNGDLYTTRSTRSWWGSPAFDPDDISGTRVGTGSLAYTGRTATFSATINGSNRTRTVTQQPFGNRAPGTP